ncbi:MAG: hypothetical protein PHX25_00795 [Candidatus Pacebacteria bacterium]|nr:hypothetical protein [Candidatus Paceibacterota bacterium]
MTIISFIVSLSLIALLFGLKIFETKTNKVVISRETLNKSDDKLKQFFIFIFRYYRKFLFEIYKLPRFFEEIKKDLKKFFARKRDRIATKVIRALNIHNIKDIDRNRGSVSLFLKTISEEKERNKKL